MALFDSIVESAKERAGLSGDQAGGLVAALLRLISDPGAGGFGGFIERFRDAGLGSVIDSWISRGDNTPISNEQVESALGADGISRVADEAGVDRATATTALSGVLPSIVDTLTPDGVVPDEGSLLSRIGGFLSDWGGAIGGAVAGGLGAATAMGRGAADKVGDAAGATYDAAGDAARAAREKVGGAVGSMGSTLDTGSGGGSALRWLIPLLLLGLAILLGYMFCGRGTTTTTNVNVNANRPVANANSNANARPANANANANANAAAGEASRTLSEVSLPDGTKLQAYAGGIEDQLVKFIQSADYKNATNDQLKDRWFNFDDLNFVFGKTELTPDSKRQLDNIVAILKAFPDAKIKIGGYTDRKGDDAGNLKLSDSRAKAVQAALQKAGVGAQVPEAEGYGEQFATVDENASDEERKVDRKTAVRLIK